jgi:hypothetical protein
MVTEHQGSPGGTRLELVFRLWGRDVVPDNITARTGVQPSRTFLVGERPARAASKVAAWEWRSGLWTDQDIEPLLTQMLEVLGPHRTIFRHEVDQGADATMTVVGAVLGDVLSTAEEADRHGWYVPEGRQFEPFFAGDRVGFFLDLVMVEFLSSVRCTFETHIDVELDRHKTSREDNTDAGETSKPDRSES